MLSDAEKLIRKRRSQKKYKASSKGKLTEHRYETSEKGKKAHTVWRKRNQLKVVAHRRVRDALRAGVLKREPCEVCGEEKGYAHHDNYLRPLEVKWFCNQHHFDYHNFSLERG